MDNRLLNRDEAAQFLGVSPQTLAYWACTKRYGLPLVKIGRLAKYRMQDLENFIQQRTSGGSDTLKPAINCISGSVK